MTLKGYALAHVAVGGSSRAAAARPCKVEFVLTLQAEMERSRSGSECVLASLRWKCVREAAAYRE